jgi:triacylglycerol esterase/lipase EstA (alpha/beta hydrolase family)
MPERKRLPIWTLILLGFIGLLAALTVGFVIWGSTPAQPMSVAFDTVLRNPTDASTKNAWLSFVPESGQPETGFIIYPGGHVDYRAYAPTAQAIADQGYLVVIVRMPLNLAVFDPNAAAQVIAGHPEIKYWAVGGHSLGGAMAANYAYKHPGEVDGLVLWGSYPAANNDLSGADLQVVSISGTLDGLSTPKKIAASISLLPPNTIWVAIEGGNHAQFGWYGDQSGDNPATISREEQQARVVRASVDLLMSLK